MSRGVWKSVSRWLKLVSLARNLWRLRQPKPLSKSFATKNTRQTASGPERRRLADFVKRSIGRQRRDIARRNQCP
ncbi:hypothetical protein [Infirmifilum sp. NZ]|uniref:hypothetical protein n=1 Tax=Infirmifilum sp. NZ TaxID=2926850 RepID=UPI0027980AD6|nr:hypothetical protein [Infirmifilum sp. NZ]UNQ72670.1 hypothetical protein MOV14_06010 [Infirmifilum sp. NZ]